MSILLDIYDYFNDKTPSPDLQTRQRDCIELLERLKSVEINSADTLSYHLQKSAASPSLKNVVEFTLFSLTINMHHISTRYYDL